jgi:uncharacterized protein
MLAILFVAAWCGSALRADVAPPPMPDRYFTDQAHVVDDATALQINEQLAQFERDTSSQILVAIYPSLPPGAELAQYCITAGNAWVVDPKGPGGQLKSGDKGAVLFVFVNDHKMFIATGRGLEGALPDATCKNIIDGIIAPAFRNGDYAGGVQAGVNAMLAAAKGEYKGTGTTHLEDEQQADSTPEISGWVIFAIILLIILSRLFFSGYVGGSPYIFTGGGFSGGGFGGGGGSGGGFSGFGGFSGGSGGGFGGGGAGGSW